MSEKLTPEQAAKKVLAVASTITGAGDAEHRHLRAVEAPLVKELIKVGRAQDTRGAWDNKTDLSLIEPYIVDKEARRRSQSLATPIRT